jgi:hypothetical protein
MKTEPKYFRQILVQVIIPSLIEIGRIVWTMSHANRWLEGLKKLLG